MAKYRQLSVNESDIQRMIVEGLRLLGFTVLSTSRIRKRCRRCGNYSSGGDGVEKGTPDLLISHVLWGCPAWLGIEVKGPKTSVSPEQRHLERCGFVRIARSWDEAGQIIRDTWHQLTRHDMPTHVQSGLGGISTHAG